MFKSKMLKVIVALLAIASIAGVAMPGVSHAAGRHSSDLLVTNYSPEPVDVYVDGWYVDTLPSYYEGTYFDLSLGYHTVEVVGLWSGGYVIDSTYGSSYNTMYFSVY